MTRAVTRRLFLWCAIAAGAAASGDDVHVLVAVQGKVTVKRKGWTTSAPAGFGTFLRRGDLVRLTSPAQATVACADLSVHQLPDGKASGVPCPIENKAIAIYEGSLINPTRSEASEEVPVVISPRRTKLLSPRPILRWAPMPGITRFKVSLRGPGVNWTAAVDGATSVSYPADAPALTPGATYKVSVNAGGHSSDELSEPGLGFTLLTEDAAKTIRAEAQRISGLPLPADAAQLLTAHVYASHGLHAEAIERLEALAKAHPAPRVWQTLGNLYQTAGLNRLAEERYVRAAKDSLATGDIESQALAQQSLGVLYQQAFGLPGEATSAFRDALTLFEKLGDARSVQELKERLAHDQNP